MNLTNPIAGDDPITKDVRDQNARLTRRATVEQLTAIRGRNDSTLPEAAVDMLVSLMQVCTGGKYGNFPALLERATRKFAE